MLKLILAALLSSSTLLAAAAGAAASLTELETRWLHAGAPVLAYSQRMNLPVDIIVQPRARPGDVPMAIGFEGGRCKLVLSMRGNPDAEKILDSVPPAERGLLIEAMTAHEIGHCWRYVQGIWHALPNGFVEAGEERADSAALLAASKAMREMRREEGFADLVALAWVRQRHPQQYGRVHAWLEALRETPLATAAPGARSGHDTRAYVRLARDASVFGAAGNPFEAASATWTQGLLNDE